MISKILLLLVHIVNLFYHPVAANNANGSSNLTLKKVFIFFRHGRRTPIIEHFLIKNVSWDKWLTDEKPPFMDVKYKLINTNGVNRLEKSSADLFYETLIPLEGGAKHGQLTVLGRLDAYYLGFLLRYRYLVSDKFNISSYSPDIIRLYTTNYQRTSNSLLSLLASMFPESNKAFEIYSRPNVEEIYHPNYRYCKNYKKIHDEQASLIKDDKRQKEIHEELSGLLNIESHELPSVSHLWEEVSTVFGQQQSIPAVFEKNYNKIQQGAFLSFMFRHLKNDRCIQYGCGLLLRDLMDIIYNDNHDLAKTKLFINSVHDSTLICLLQAFEYKMEEWPTFSSYFSVEILTDNQNEIFVQGVFNGKKIIPPFEVKSESDFQKHFRKFIPNEKDFLNLCEH